LATRGVLPLCTLGVHDLRYQLAFGDHARDELAAQGHAYLNSLTPICALLAALVAAELIARLAPAHVGRADTAPRVRLAGLAGAITLALVGLYAGQEALEGLLSAGHPTGFDGVFGDGGWWS